MFLYFCVFTFLVLLSGKLAGLLAVTWLVVMAPLLIWAGCFIFLVLFAFVAMVVASATMMR